MTPFTPATAASLSPATTTALQRPAKTYARRCGVPDCPKASKQGGFCISHGGGKKCAVEGCTTSVVSRGFCVAHGGGKRCQFSGCTKSAQAGGSCWIHGGGKKCGFEGCVKRAQSGGACIAHGGGKRCRVEDCNKVVQYAGLCVSHGGFRRCILEGCTKKALSNSFCAAHGGSSRLRQVSREINERRTRSPSQWNDQDVVLRTPVHRCTSLHKLEQMQTPPSVDRVEEAFPRFLSRESLPSLLQLDSSRSEHRHHRLPTIAELQARRPLPPRDLFAPEKRVQMSFQRPKAELYTTVTMSPIVIQADTRAEWRWHQSSLEYMV